MNWIKVRNELPKILKGRWRTDKPVLAKNAQGEVIFSYFEKITEKDRQRYVGIEYTPKFVCEDRLSDFFNDVLEDIVEWSYLPE